MKYQWSAEEVQNQSLILNGYYKTVWANIPLIKALQAWTSKKKSRMPIIDNLFRSHIFKFSINIMIQSKVILTMGMDLFVL
jgi:hypothetical protein